MKSPVKGTGEGVPTKGAPFTKGVKSQWWDFKDLNDRRTGGGRVFLYVPQFKALGHPLLRMHLGDPSHSCAGQGEHSRCAQDRESVPHSGVLSPKLYHHRHHRFVIFNFLLILGLELRSKNPSKCFREMVMVLH